jgi:Spy/CpxP family protein refolding chaperone
MTIHRMRRWVLIGGTCGAFAAAGLAAPAPDKGRGRRGEGFMNRIQSQLNLTADQEKKLKQNREAHREVMKTLHEALRAQREALGAELEKTSFDMNRVKSIHEELKGIEARMADQRLSGILEVRQILTPEQFKKFGALTREAWKKGGVRGDRGPGRGVKGKKGRGASPNGETLSPPEGDQPPPPDEP